MFPHYEVQPEVDIICSQAQGSVQILKFPNANTTSVIKVMGSLRTLPKLKKCRIRLGRQNNTDLQTLAQRTAVEMTNTFIPAPGFPFSRLPKELRLEILSYTHLGTPGSYDLSADKIYITSSKLNRYTDPLADLQDAAINVRILSLTAAAHQIMMRIPQPVFAGCCLWICSL